MPAELYGAGGALAALAFTLLALIRGDLVPGWIHRREIARGDKADDQADRTAKALETIVRLYKLPPGE
jgi:hypothetical protein